jgi:uncharacterized membrane protein YeaQ/YmgE (transglycosylase-associated protein family)
MAIGLITWIILGALAGWITSKIDSHASHNSLGNNILIGMVGALLGGLIVQFIGGSGVTGFNLYSLVVAVLGSMLFLWLLRKFGKKV